MSTRCPESQLDLDAVRVVYHELQDPELRVAHALEGQAGSREAGRVALDVLAGDREVIEPRGDAGVGGVCGTADQVEHGITAGVVEPGAARWLSGRCGQRARNGAVHEADHLRVEEKALVEPRRVDVHVVESVGAHG